MVDREGSYVDGKYVYRRLIARVEEKVVNLRFAYKNLSTVFCRDSELNELVRDAGIKPLRD